MKQSRIVKRMVTLFLIIAMAAAFMPAMAFADSGNPQDDESITVYFTLSDDSDFVKGKDGDETIMARVPVRISYTSLGIYGLEKYNRYEADSFENGGQYNSPVIVQRPTLLMLYLKMLGQYYLDREFTKSDVGTDALTITGSPTSLYMTRFWGHDENLMYFVNHEYPLMAKGWGSTSDYILLNDGDEIDVAMFTDWSFWQYGAFATFDNNNPNIRAGSSVTLTMTSSGTSAGMNGETVDAGAVMAEEPIRISSDYGHTWEQTDYVTDEKGKFTAEFRKPGVYYLSGGPEFKYQEEKGSDTACVAPPISVVEVAPGQPSELSCEKVTDQSVSLKWNAVDGADGYLVKYRKNGDSKWSSVTAESNSSEISGLKSNTEYSVKVSAFVKDKYVPAGEETKKLEGKDSEQISAATIASALDNYKIGLKRALNKYRDASLYKEEQKTALQKAIQDGETAIDAASDQEEADNALVKAEKEIDGIPTIAQLLAEKKTSAQNEAITYYQERESRLDASEGGKTLLKGIGDISGAGTEDAVDTALDNLKAAIDKLVKAKSDADEQAAEALKSAKAEAVQQIREKVKAAPEGDARTDAEAIAEKAEVKIEAAGSIDTVAEITSSAVESIEKAILKAEEAARNKAAVDALEAEKAKAERQAAAYKEKLAREKVIGAAKRLRVTGFRAVPKSKRGNLSWKRNSKASGYQVQYKTKTGKYKTLKLTSSNKSVKYKTKKLRKGKKYYYRVRCYKMINGKQVFGVWSQTERIWIR